MRFTPAYAGKIGAGLAIGAVSGVHPRIRGEDQVYQMVQGLFPGSPPHTRGRFKSLFCLRGQVRFTPAYAGKIMAGSRSYGVKEVHPRIRGEDLVFSHSPSASAGSPPHTRGRS